MFCIDESHPNKNNKDKPAGYKFTYEQYRRALYARCLLANIWCFGIDFKEFNGELEQALADSNQVHIVHKKDNITRIYGRPTDELINEYANIVCILAANGAEVPFSEVYVGENKNLLCSDNDALYSGVIPRLKNITFDPPSVGNNKVNKMTLELGRTSFMTIMGLHLTIGGKYCDDLLNHPFLKTITADGVSLSEINKEFEKHEASLQGELIEKLKDNIGFEKELDAINSYLSQSFNVHNVNISGNIVTKDGYCVYTKRNNKMTDANQYYCSVNGGAEINDSSVRYYHNANKEDIPTIEYSTETVYFGGELTRESIAELGDTDISPYWNYYGVTCMSHYTDDYDKDRNTLWMHFNVLGERVSPYSLEQINEMRMQASESFENKSMHGYSIIQYHSRREMFITYLLKVTELIQDNSDIIIAVLMGYQIYKYRQIYDSLPNTIITILLGIISALLLLNRAVSTYKSFKTYKRFIVNTYKSINLKRYKKDCIEKFNSDFSKKLKAGSDLDAIFYMLTNLHLLNEIKRHNET